MDDAVRIWSNPGFERERSDLRALEPREATAITHAITKLRVEGTRLGFPWTSAVRQSPLPGLRELRPRGGRSRHRVLYQQVSGGFELLAIAREASRQCLARDLVGVVHVKGVTELVHHVVGDVHDV